MTKTEIKYLEGSFARAYKNRADFLFLLRLKSHYKSGLVKESLSSIGKKIGESPQTSLYRLRSLSKLNWVQIHKKDKKIFYSLISYDKLYENLGFKRKSGGRGFKGLNKIEKISSCFSKKELEFAIAEFELKRKLERMNYMNNKGKIRTGKCVPLPVSCRTTAKILGYKSALKGFQIQKLLEDQEVVTIERSSVLLKKSHSFCYALDRKNTFFYSGSTYFVHTKDRMGNIYERECNKILFNYHR